MWHTGDSNLYDISASVLDSFPSFLNSYQMFSKAEEESKRHAGITHGRLIKLENQVHLQGCEICVKRGLKL